jgi:hypothetical protein
MKRVISSKALSAVLIAAAFAGAGAVPASAQAVTKEGSALPHYFDKDGSIVWGGWGPQAAEQHAAAPSRTLYLSTTPHARRNHAN